MIVIQLTGAKSVTSQSFFGSGNVPVPVEKYQYDRKILRVAIGLSVGEVMAVAWVVLHLHEGPN